MNPSVSEIQSAIDFLLELPSDIKSQIFGSNSVYKILQNTPLTSVHDKISLYKNQSVLNVGDIVSFPINNIKKEFILITWTDGEFFNGINPNGVTYTNLSNVSMSKINKSLPEISDLLKKFNSLV